MNNLTPFVPLSLKGEGEERVFEGASPLELAFTKQN